MGTAAVDCKFSVNMLFLNLCRVPKRLPRQYSLHFNLSAALSLFPNSTVLAQHCSKLSELPVEYCKNWTHRCRITRLPGGSLAPRTLPFVCHTLSLSLFLSPQARCHHLVSLVCVMRQFVIVACLKMRFKDNCRIGRDKVRTQPHACVWEKNRGRGQSQRLVIGWCV